MVSVDPIPLQMDTWTAITVAAWVKNDDGAVSQTHDIASFWNYPSSRSWVLTHHKNNQYFWEIAGQGNVSGGSVSTDWAHVVGTYEGTTMRLYMDGVEVASRPVSGGPLPSATAALLIGGQANNANYFEGLMDDVKVYDRALDGQEVQILFQAESP